MFTSDHGDYLGDHWLGEKELFHEPSVKVPLIIYDPTAEADAARGTVCDELVEAIDLAPTFLVAVGADPAEQAHRLEGRSLMPLLRGDAAGGVAALRHQRIRLLDEARGPCARRRAARCPPVHDLRPALEICARRRLPADAVRPANDPEELRDLGRDPAYQAERDRLEAALGRWGLRLSQRTTLSDSQIRGMRGKVLRRGILIGVWDEMDIPEELWSRYQGEAASSSK